MIQKPRTVFFFFLISADKLLSLKRFSKMAVKKLGKEEQVLKEKELLKHLASTSCVPRVICTFADQTHASILFDTRLACSLVSILHVPLDEASARFCAASVVTSLEDLHKVLCL